MHEMHGEKIPATPPQRSLSGRTLADDISEARTNPALWLDDLLRVHLSGLFAKRYPAFFAWWRKTALDFKSQALREIARASSEQELYSVVQRVWSDLGKIDVPRTLAGYRLPDDEQDELLLASRFDLIWQALGRVHRVHDLRTITLPPVLRRLYRRLEVPLRRQPKLEEIQQWRKSARSVEQFIYRLLAHLHGRKESYIRRRVSQGRPDWAAISRRPAPKRRKPGSD